MRTITVCVVCLTASNLFAQDTPSPATEVKIYHVADLVAVPAVKQSAAYRPVTHEEWSDEHPKSIESLNKLAKLIETIVPADTGAVAAHEDSLSLVVRHTAEAHAQIEKLLDQLRVQERPTIELTLIPTRIFSSNGSLTDDQEARLYQLLVKQVLNEDETKEVTALLEKSIPVNSEFELLMKPIKARLVNGRKTRLHRCMMPACATVVIPEGKDEFLVRIDTIVDGIDDGSPKMIGQSSSFTVPAGHSAFSGPEFSDDETVWLAIPKRIEPEQKVTATSGETIYRGD